MPFFSPSSTNPKLAYLPLSDRLVVCVVCLPCASCVMPLLTTCLPPTGIPTLAQCSALGRCQPERGSSHQHPRPRQPAVLPLRCA
jgi:hypothetical protein